MNMNMNAKETEQVFQGIGEAIATAVEQIYDAFQTIDISELGELVEGIVMAFSSIIESLLRLIGIFGPFITFMI